MAQLVEESACNVGDLGSVPGLGRSPRGGHGTPLQYSCLESPMDRGAWRAAVHGVTKSQTRLSSYEQHSGDWRAELGFVILSCPCPGQGNCGPGSLGHFMFFLALHLDYCGICSFIHSLIKLSLCLKLYQEVGIQR